MPTEVLYATSHIAGTFTNPDNALGNTPSTWAGDLNNNSNYTSRWAIGDPIDSLTGTQTIRILARKGSNSGTPTIALNLYEDGVLVASILAATNITSTTGQTLTATFNASQITNRNNIEIEVVQTGQGGNTSTRNTAQIAYIEFEAQTAEASAPNEGGFNPLDTTFVGWGGTAPQEGVFLVDNYSGTDLQKAQAAVNAAISYGQEAVVEFGASTYTFSGPLQVHNSSEVTLRGQGSSTVIKAGWTGSATNNADTPGLIEIRGNTASITADIAVDVFAGSKEIVLTDASSINVGDWILLNQQISGNAKTVAETANVTMDPGGGVNDGHGFEIQQVVAKTGNTIEFANPIGADFTASRSVTIQRINPHQNNAVEDMHLEGHSFAHGGNYLSLIRFRQSIAPLVKNVSFRWASRSFIDCRDAPGVVIDGIDATDEMGQSAEDNESSVYGINLHRSPDAVVMPNCVFGDDSTDLGRKSFVTVNLSHRYDISGTYGRTKTYCFNEHGFCTRYGVFHDATLRPGPNANFGGILLGNSTWGFAGDCIIRDVTQYGGTRFLDMQENTFGVRVRNCHVEDLTGEVIRSYGWAGPTTDPDLYGSIRLSVEGMTTTNCAGDGIVLSPATPKSPHFEFNGVRDVWLDDNDWSGIAGQALVVPGGGSQGSVSVVDNFDAGITGWTTSSATLAHDTSVMHEGAGSLAVTNVFGTGWSGRNVFRLNTPKDRTAEGDTVGVWVRIPASAPGTGWTGRIGIQDSAFTWHGLTSPSSPQISLVKGEWTFVSWAPGSAILTDVNRFGIEVAANNSIVSGTQEITYHIDSYRQADNLSGGDTAVVENVPHDEPRPLWAYDTFFTNFTYTSGSQIVTVEVEQPVAEGAFDFLDTTFASWGGTAPSLDVPEGQFDVLDNVSVVWGGMRSSEGTFTASGISAVEWNGTAPSLDVPDGQFGLLDNTAVAWSGESTEVAGFTTGSEVVTVSVVIIPDPPGEIVATTTEEGILVQMAPVGQTLPTVPSAGDFDLTDTTTVEWAGLRISTGQFDVVDSITVDWSADVGSFDYTSGSVVVTVIVAPSGAFNLVDNDAVGWSGNAPSLDVPEGQFGIVDTAHAEWSGITDSAGSFDLADSSTVAWGGFAPSLDVPEGQFSLVDSVTVSWEGIRDSEGSFDSVDSVAVFWQGLSPVLEISEGQFDLVDSTFASWSGWLAAGVLEDITVSIADAETKYVVHAPVRNEIEVSEAFRERYTVDGPAAILFVHEPEVSVVSLSTSDTARYIVELPLVRISISEPVIDRST